MGTLGAWAPSVRLWSPPDRVPGWAGDASRSGHELKRACADSKGDLARGAAPQRTLNRQSSSQEVGTTARSFAALVEIGTIVTRSGSVSCGEPTPVLTSAFGGIVVEAGGGSVDAAVGSVVALGAGAMAGVFDSGGGEVSVEAVDGSVEPAGGVSVEAAGGTVEAVGGVTVEAVDGSVEPAGGVTVGAVDESVEAAVGFGGVGGVVAAGWVSDETGGDSVVAVDGSVEEAVGSCETAGGFVAAPLEAGAGSSARATSTNAEAASEAATRASAHPRGLSDRRRRLGSRLLKTTTLLPSRPHSLTMACSLRTGEVSHLAPEKTTTGGTRANALNERTASVD
jgi:hypothetical protein